MARVARKTDWRPFDDDDAPAMPARRRWPVILWLAGVVVLAVVVISGRLMFRHSPSGPATTQVLPPVSAGAAVTPGSGLPAGQIVAGAADQIVTADVAPGIDLCGSHSMGVASQQIAGFGTLFPRTLEGAVAAAANLNRYLASYTVVLDNLAPSLNAALFTGSPSGAGGWDDGQRAGNRRSIGIDAAGQAWDYAHDTGLPQVTARHEAYPQYGAYKILAVNTDTDLDTGATVPQTVWVEWMMPKVFTFLDTTLPDYVGNYYTYYDVTVTVVEWAGGADSDAMSWRAGGSPQSASSAGIWSFDAPGVARPTNLSFADRATLVGPGWCLPADATEMPLPDAVNTITR